ncbi:cytochrome P450 family protein [Micromonospora sp. DT201]|uniref:cytochrome P450 family protein n=1 Tax=Micromonospora sp. DT201 TaxID=3393442 RepID=UPI003CEE5898
MSDVRTKRVLSRYAIFTSDYLREPHPIWERMRAEQPVYCAEFPEGGGRCWVVSRYADVRAALLDPRLSKDAGRMHEVLELQLSKGGRHDTFPESLASHMLNSDPPVHTRLRKLVTKAFTARRVTQLRPGVEQVTDELIEGMAAGPTADLITDFAFQLPITVICELLGVAMDDRKSFRGWSNVIAGDSTTDQLGRASEAMSAYLARVVVDKRENPADDLLSSLMTAADDGDRLTDAEGVSMAFLLLMAGYETTVNLIGNGMAALLQEREQFEMLKANPELTPGAVEEFLRYGSPVHTATTRFTAEATRIGDVTIPADEVVLLCLGSANWDEGRFAGADRLDITRTANKHMAFGHGIHHCLGAPLARMEADVAFRRLLKRFPDMRLAVPPESLEWRHGNIVRGLKSLPIRL